MGRGIFRRLRLALQRPPVRDDLRPLAVNLQPGQRVVDRRGGAAARAAPGRQPAGRAAAAAARESGAGARRRVAASAACPAPRAARAASAENRRARARKTERHQQRADEDGVGQRVGRRGETRAVAIERAPSTPRAPARRPSSSGVIACSSLVCFSMPRLFSADPERRILKYSSSRRGGALRAISWRCVSIASSDRLDRCRSRAAPRARPRAACAPDPRGTGRSGSPIDRITRRSQILEPADVVDDRERARCRRRAR